MRFMVFITALFAAAPSAAEIVDFMLPDLEGKPVSLSDFRGKWVIVNYWATWCPPCLEEIPELVSLHDDNRDTLVVLGVDYEEVNTNYLREFVESHMMSYPIVRMDPIPVTRLGPVMGLPTTYIISPEGERVARQEGPVTQEAIEQYIARKQGGKASIPMPAGSMPPSATH
ncbi:MAG: TlpA family protein disulfide reductase [Gammaproteobacteria bacterium]|jgi:thiol-disulfide isomerase/thioredoxin|nr:TlpA family protein disulfide reductase [Gammaproteobacteria bacterium]